MEPRTARVVVDEGVSLHVDVWSSGADLAGDGPGFLLAHGLASNARMWTAVGTRLAELGYDAAAVDLRGHGRSDKPDTGYDFATVASDVARVADALGFVRPVVAGQSWGGNVVLELAARRPGFVRGVACIDGGWIEPSRRFPSWEACRDALTPPPTSGLPLVRVEAEIRRMHPDWPESGIAGLLANFDVRPDGSVAPHLTLERHLLILRQLWEHRPSQRYPLIEDPVLLVPASSSTAWSDAVLAAQQGLARVRTASIDGDHDLHAQRPFELAELLHGAVADGFFS